MILQIKKQIQTSKPVKAFKVVCLVETKYFTGPFRIEQVQPDEWVMASDRTADSGFCAILSTASSPSLGYYAFKSLSHNRVSPNVGYHAFKSLAMANRGVTHMARRGLLSWKGYVHCVVPVYLRGEVSFGTYYEKFKGVKGSQMLIKSKHLPEVRA